jgi:GAF domain-containing protein
MLRYVRLAATAAVETYTQWGALAKVRQLEERYSFLQTTDDISVGKLSRDSQSSISASHKSFCDLRKNSPSASVEATLHTSLQNATLGLPLMRSASQIIQRDASLKDIKRAVSSSSLMRPLQINNELSSQLSLRSSSGSKVSKASSSVDVNTILKATQSITNEVSLENVLKEFLHHTATNSGATNVILLWSDQESDKNGSIQTDEMHIHAQLYLDNNEEKIDFYEQRKTSSFKPSLVPLSIVQFVRQSKGSIIIVDAKEDLQFNYDPYIQQTSLCSVLCTPIVQKGILMGILYLEHRFIPGIFTVDTLEVVKSLATSAVISIENFKLKKANIELETALLASTANKEQATEVPRYNVDGPIKHAMEILFHLRRRQPTLKKDIEFILNLLLSNKSVFASNIDHIHDESGKRIDSDTRDWIRMMLNPVNSNEAPVKELPKQAFIELSSPTSPADGNQDESQDELKAVLSDVNDISQLRQLLDQVHSPNFDVFLLSDVTNGHPLLVLGHHLIYQVHNLTNYFPLDMRRLIRFFYRVESEYRDVPYHSSKHGADVVSGS